MVCMTIRFTLAFGSGPRECPGKYMAMTECVTFAREIMRAFSSVHFDPDVSGPRGERVKEAMRLTQQPANLALRFQKA